MLFFKRKEDMGLEASLKLLDLPPDATIDDANQAYAYLHRMIDLFHQETGPEDRGDRQEDIDLLTCAYEKAAAYLFDRDPRSASSAEIPPRLSVVDAPESTDVRFTLDLSADADEEPSLDVAPPLPEPNTQTVEDAISITSRRLHRTELVLPDVQQTVESGMAAAEAANRRHVKAKQARMNAVVAAKSAKTRALLLEIEAKRAMDNAIAVAERARDRAVAARQAAKEAMSEANKAREQASRVIKSEETAAAEALCAEDRLEKEKDRLKALTHTLIQTRSRMKMFQGTMAETEAQNSEAHIHSPAAMTDDRFSSSQAAGGEAAARQQIMSDLLEIEASLNVRKPKPVPVDLKGETLPDTTGRALERRQHRRISYPFDQCPVFCIDGRTIPILDLSTAGMRLEPDDAMGCPCIVRGTIAFADSPPVKVTGKVVRQDDGGLGLKLMTRIGNHILDQECFRLSAVVLGT